MAPKIEGTFYLDGLLEGRLCSEDDERLIRRFVVQTQADGLLFYSKIDRGHFSLLPKQQSCSRKTFDVSVDSRLRSHLETLLRSYSAGECGRFMSTLRSVEYIEGYENQVVYGIDANGAVVIEKRTVPAETTPPEKGLTTKQKIRFIASVSVIVLLALLVSSIFVPYRDIAVSVIESIMPYDVKGLDVSGRHYTDYFTLKEAAVNTRDRTIVLIFKPTAKFPATREQLNSEWLRVSDDMERRLVIEAIARKRFPCVLFTKEGKYYLEHTARMVWNEDGDEFSLTLPFVKSLGKIELEY